MSSDGTPIIIKKKKVHGHGHHGGAWKVAYADFVTAMMAFFMVMWIMGMDSQTRSMVQGYFNDPFGFLKNPPKSESIIPFEGMPPSKPGKSVGAGDDPMKKDEADMRSLEGKLQKEIDGLKDGTGGAELKALLKNVEMSIDREGLRVEFVESAGSVFFESGKSVVRPAAQQLVRKMAPILQASGRNLVVEGHTDSAPFAGDPLGNWRLSTERAQAMGVLLAQSGVSPRRFRGMRGLADTSLKNPGNPLHFSNRRVTVLMPFSDTKEGGKVEGLPKDVLKEEIQGVFRRDIEIAPNRAPSGHRGPS